MTTTPDDAAVEAVAYLHTMTYETGETRVRLSESDINAFGEPGRDYSAEYPVTVEPLYRAAHTTTRAEDAATIARLREAVIVARDQFAFYAREHSAVGKEEKAATNQALADTLSRALGDPALRIGLTRLFDGEAVMGHTAPPWAVSHDNKSHLCIVTLAARNRKGFGSKIATMAISRQSDRHLEAEADARLIAAAPEILEALREITEVKSGSPLDRNIKMKGIARAAIAKADGPIYEAKVADIYDLSSLGDPA